MEKTPGELPPAYDSPSYGSSVQSPPGYQNTGQQQHMTYPTTGQPQTYGYNQEQQQHTNVIVHQPIAVPVHRGSPPKDLTGAAIFACICCFIPTGIVAILKASEANTAWQRGDTELAYRHAHWAKIFIILSIILGIVVASAIVAIRVTIINNNDY